MAQYTPNFNEETETPQIPTEQVAQASPSSRSKLRRWILTVVVLLATLAVVVVAVVAFLGGDDEMTAEEELEAGLTASEEKAIVSDAPIFSNTMSYQVNLADGRRYLSTDIRMEVVDNDTILYIGRRLPIINDLIITTIQRKTGNELRTASGVDRLKRDLKRRLNSGKVFTEEFIKLKNTTTPIEEIYFDKFILQ